MPFHKKELKTSMYNKIAIVFFGISALLALVVFYISFSWATIVIAPVAKSFAANSEIAISGTLSEFDPQQKEMPGTVVQEEMEGEGTFATTTVKPIEQTTQVGIITVINKTAKAQQMRATTRFLHESGSLFRSTEYAVVPAGGRVDVPVKLDTQGQTSIQSGSNQFVLPGLWEGVKDQIYGIAFQEDTKKDSEQKILIQADIDSGTQEVVQKLKEKFALLLDSSQAKSSSAKMAQFVTADIINVAPNLPLNSITDQFTIKVKILMKGVLVDELQLKNKIRKELINTLSQDQELIGPREQDIKVTLASADAKENKALLSVDASASHIRSALSANYDRKKLSGMSAQEIQSYFSLFDDITDVQVRFYPFWVTRAPILLDHINVMVQK